MKEEEIAILIEEKITLRGRVYWPELTCFGSTSTILILCHGLPAASVEKKEEPSEIDGGYPALARQCVATLNIPVFHFNFRGTGESGGDLDLQGWRRDLTAILDYWEKRDSTYSFILWGFSAGALVSACTAADDPRVISMILAASPSGFREIFPKQILPDLLTRFRTTGLIRDPAFPPDPDQWLENFHTMEPLQHLPRFAPRPLLLLHGSSDELIPLDHVYRLFQAAGIGKVLLIIHGARHQLRKEEEAVDNALIWLKSRLRNREY